MWSVNDRNSESDLVTIYSGGDQSAIALARCLLDDAGVKYAVRHDNVSDLFRLGRLGGFNVFTGPVLINVRHEDEDAARSILGDIHISRQRIPLIVRVLALLNLTVALAFFVAEILNTIADLRKG